MEGVASDGGAVADAAVVEAVAGGAAVAVVVGLVFLHAKTFLQLSQ